MQEARPCQGQLHLHHLCGHDAEGQVPQGPLLHSSAHHIRVSHRDGTTQLCSGSGSCVCAQSLSDLVCRLGQHASRCKNPGPHRSNLTVSTCVTCHAVVQVLAAPAQVSKCAFPTACWPAGWQQHGGVRDQRHCPGPIQKHAQLCLVSQAQPHLSIHLLMSACLCGR